MSNRKEILYAIIDHITDLSLWDELTDFEKDKLKDAQDELALLEQTEEHKESTEHKKARQRGRYGERRLAKKVNGVVVGRSKWIVIEGKGYQINCQQPPDVISPPFAFESKWLKQVPKMLDKVMTQAIRNCPKDLTPVAVIGDREQRVCYYIMTEKDWLDWHIGGKVGA